MQAGLDSRSTQVRDGAISRCSIGRDGDVQVKCAVPLMIGERNDPGVDRGERAPIDSDEVATSRIVARQLLQLTTPERRMQLI